MGSAESNVWSKDPSGNNFANATFASVTEGRAVTLGQTIEPNDISFGPGTYNFGLIVERYGGELDVNVSITNEATGFSIVSPSFTEANASRQTFVFDRVGLLAGSTLDADQIRFQNMDVAVSDIARPTLEVHSSGLVVMTNPTNQAEDLTQYEIASAAGSLNPSGWASLDDGESNDPVGSGWDQAGGSSANLLAEVNLLSSETLTAGEHRSLGEAFVAGAAPDLAFHYTAAGEIRRGIVKYVQSGDFNRDGSVDAADYVLWRKSKGATVPAGSFADGDGNGQIDAADLVVFRNNFGAGDLAAVQAVTAPEPAAWIAISFLAPMFVGRMRGFHRRHRN
jgi:hypothetical protein